MAIGDDAINAGMDAVDGASTMANTIDDEINKTRDYVAQRTSAVTPVSKGGTGATSAAAARSNLGAAPTNHTHPWSEVTGRPSTYPPSGHTHPWSQITGEPSTYPPSHHTHPWGDITGEPSTYPPSAHSHDKITGSSNFVQIGKDGTGARMWTDSVYGRTYPAASVDENNGGTSVRLVCMTNEGTFGTVVNDVYFPDAHVATSSYTVAYINGDGRLSKGASSERYKHDIHEVDPATLGDLWPRLHSYVLNDDPDETTRLGYIAERLHEAGGTLRSFVVYDHAGQPDSIDFIGLLLTQTAALRQQVQDLTTRLDNLENTK